MDTLWGILADAVLVFHLGFIVFVVVGGFAAVRWPRVAWLHLPCALWGAAVEFIDGVCPLTPLENTLREMAGGSAYSTTGFVERYLVPLVYPGALTRELQIALGAAVIAVNLVAYTLVLRARRSPSGSGPRRSE